MTVPLPQQKKRVAVIGAGASGLAAIKECLDERDLVDVVAFERESYLGGLWRYVEVSEENPNPHSSVYKSTIINTSKELMTYSDFPIPLDWPTYPPNTKVALYLDKYAEHFDLRRHIRFNTQVVEVRELHDAQRRWSVRFHPFRPATANASADSLQEPEIQEEIFDYVMMCSGHHWKPRYPSFPGMNSSDPEGYTGEQLHSHFYRQADTFRDKTVVVVGLGNSAVDLAVELSLNQSQVYLSCRRPAWVAPRFILGKPLDHHRTRLTHAMPLFLLQLIVMWMFRRSMPPIHENMKPARRVFESHPTVNTLLPERITTGTVKPVKNIKKLGPGKRVEFEDGTVVDHVDAIFYCTGYHISFPVLDPSIVTDGKAGSEENNQVWTWNYMVPPRHPNMAFVGLFQPLGAVMPISEMQCRFLVRTLVGKTALLPSELEMDKDISALKKYISTRYDNAPRHTIQVDYVTYCDNLATRLGCFPTFAKLIVKFGLVEALRLRTEMFFGPPTPLQYRLVGPHAWEGAREATWGYAGNAAFANTKYLKDFEPSHKNKLTTILKQ
ncbi:Cyclopentanone 1,2-monooxygenase (CPMO) [Mortierella sp. 14UC]|nr:Cyclopentanone 1,2-monooxygenase (CPMO) [Mortierella sp. 14UC]